MRSGGPWLSSDLIVFLQRDTVRASTVSRRRSGGCPRCWSGPWPCRPLVAVARRQPGRKCWRKCDGMRGHVWLGMRRSSQVSQPFRPHHRAVVGDALNQAKPAFRIAQKLRDSGKEVFVVNPRCVVEQGRGIGGRSRKRRSTRGQSLTQYRTPLVGIRRARRRTPSKP